MTPENIRERMAKGSFKPHIYLTNVCLAFFQAAGAFVSKRMFPIVPVPLSTARYYEFDKGDLARDNVGLKPEYGQVAPAIFGKRDKQYRCDVEQVITGVDQISALDYQRAGAPGVIDPRRAKARFIAEQMNIHLDRKWAGRYFNPEAWGGAWEGVGTSPAQGARQFWHFDNANCDPVALFNKLGNGMLLAGLRRPNRICMGANVFAALQTNPSVMERIMANGSEANPAAVTANVLSQLFKVDEIAVAESVCNVAKAGEPDDIRFICDPDSLLLAYAAGAPSIEEPSAGYTFAWDMLGDGQYTAVQQYQGEPAAHTEFMEGLLCTDPRVVCKDLGVFMKGAVSPGFEL